MRPENLYASLGAELERRPMASTREIRRLLRHGVDIRTRGLYGSTVLTAAVQADDVSLAKRALDSGVSVGVPGRISPLCLAAENGSSGVVGLLLARGAMVDEREPYGGMTPLMVAANYCKPAVIRTLIAAGSDPTLRDDEGKTALDRVRVTDDGGRDLRLDLDRAESVRLLEDAAARKRSARVLRSASPSLNARMQRRKGHEGR